MLDACSYLSPPSREEAANEVFRVISREVTGGAPSDLLDICRQVVFEMPSLGSYTGWYVSFRHDAAAAVRLNLANPPWRPVCPSSLNPTSSATESTTT